MPENGDWNLLDTLRSRRSFLGEREMNRSKGKYPNPPALNTRRPQVTWAAKLGSEVTSKLEFAQNVKQPALTANYCPQQALASIKRASAQSVQGYNLFRAHLRICASESRYLWKAFPFIEDARSGVNIKSDLYAIDAPS
jgi:hypothetical protein